MFLSRDIRMGLSVAAAAAASSFARNAFAVDEVAAGAAAVVEE